MEIFKRIAIADKLPGGKGRGIVALEEINVGDIIAKWYPYDLRAVDKVHRSLKEFRTSIENGNPKLTLERRQEILNHSWPTPDGKIVVLTKDCPFGYINHFKEPTVLHNFHTDVWITKVNKHLYPGDELVFDYNIGSKYDVRTDSYMIEFHALCEKNGVSKHPSIDMTIGPSKIKIGYVDDDDDIFVTDSNDILPLRSDTNIRSDNNAEGLVTEWV